MRELWLSNFFAVFLEPPIIKKSDYQRLLVSSKNAMKMTILFSGPILLRHIMKQQNWGKIQDIQILFIPKSLNAPNVAQLQPIEEFWANLKRKIYVDNY